MTLMLLLACRPAPSPQETASAPQETGQEPLDTASPWTLVFAEEFEGSGAFDPALWTPEEGFVRNEELQWYQGDNAFREDGLLILEAREERFRNPDMVPGSDDWREQRQFVEVTSASLVSTQATRFEVDYVRVYQRDSGP